MALPEGERLCGKVRTHRPQGGHRPDAGLWRTASADNPGPVPNGRRPLGDVSSGRLGPITLLRTSPGSRSSAGPYSAASRHCAVFFERDVTLGAMRAGAVVPMLLACSSRMPIRAVSASATPVRVRRHAGEPCLQRAGVTTASWKAPSARGSAAQPRDQRRCRRARTPSPIRPTSASSTPRPNTPLRVLTAEASALSVRTRISTSSRERSATCRPRPGAEHPGRTAGPDSIGAASGQRCRWPSGAG